VDAQMTELGTPLQRQDFLMSLVKGFPGHDSSEEDWQQEHLNTYLRAAYSKLVAVSPDDVSDNK
jgi:esterase/lipase